MNNHMILYAQNNYLHTLVYVVTCVITRSFLKHTDLNITKFLPKILIFPVDCTSSGLSQDPSDKKTNY